MKFDRRKFLAAAAVAGATGAVSPSKARPATAPDAAAAGCRRRCRRTPMLPPPRPARRSCRRSEGGKPGSDFMVDVIKTLDIKYLPANPASSYPRHPRVADQLRQEHDAGIPHLHARGIRRRHVPRLLQGDRQAAHDAGPRRRRPAARHHGDLQRLVRPRAGPRHRRQRSRRRAPSRRACRPSTRRRTSTRSCATTPSGTTIRSRRSISPSRSCACTRSRPRRPTAR